MKQQNVNTHQFEKIFATVLATIFIFGALIIFSISVNELKKEISYDSLQDLANKSTAFVNEELRHYLEVLENSVQFFDEYELHDPVLLEKLGRIADSTDFQRFGVADATGISFITNGKTLNISNRDYFKASMQGKTMVTNIISSEIVNKKIVICSIPVYDQNNSVRGVFYGVLELDEIRLFNHKLLETQYQYVHIIDNNGDYIYQSKHKNKITSDSTNFFEGIDNLKINKSISDIQNKIKNDKSVTIEVSKGDDERFAFFNPLDHSDWTVVCVVDKEFMSSSIDGLINKDVFFLIMAISGALILLEVVLMHYSKKEKEYIQYLYRELERSEEVFRKIASKQDNIVFIYDVRKDIIRFISEKVGVLPLNVDIENASIKLPQLLQNDEDVKKVWELTLKSLSLKEPFFSTEFSFKNNGIYLYYEICGRSIFDENGNIEMFVGNIDEITKEKEKEKSLILRAEVDSLTRVYNREGGIEKIKKQLLQDGEHAMILLDLDHFKELNDTLGHQNGDQALIDVSRILRHHFRSEDIICRLGGDEFVVFIENISKDVVLKVVDVLLRKLRLTYTQQNKSVEISASIGIVLIPTHGVEFGELYYKADKALYRAKSKGKNCSCLYNDEPRASNEM